MFRRNFFKSLLAVPFVGALVGKDVVAVDVEKLERLRERSRTEQIEKMNAIKRSLSAGMVSEKEVRDSLNADSIRGHYGLCHDRNMVLVRRDGRVDEKGNVEIIYVFRSPEIVAQPDPLPTEV